MRRAISLFLVGCTAVALPLQGARAQLGEMGGHTVEITGDPSSPGGRECVIKSDGNREGAEVYLKLPEDYEYVRKPDVGWADDTFDTARIEPDDTDPNTYVLQRPQKKQDVEDGGDPSGEVKAVVMVHVRDDPHPTDCGRYTLFEAAEEVKPDPDSSSPLWDYDPAAYRWWLEELEKGKSGAFGKLKKELKTGPKKRNLRKHHYLVHLPSGAVAAPYPSDITEGTRAQVVMILPTDVVASVGLDIKQCSVPQTFRATFDVEPDAKLQAGRPGEEKEVLPPFDLRAVGPRLRCGPETLEYEIETQLERPGPTKKTPVAERSQRLRVNRKYHIAATFMVGWDTSKGTEYFKNTGEEPVEVDDGMGGTTTELVEVTRVDQRQTAQGAIFYVGAVWMVGGVDYHNMRWWNYFVNPFIAVNLVSPLDDIAVGLAVTPTGGISLALGMGLHKRTRLDNGFEVGDVFIGDGAIPTSRTWSKPDLGFLVGLTIDSNVFRALQAKFD